MRRAGRQGVADLVLVGLLTSVAVAILVEVLRAKGALPGAANRV